MRALPVIRLNIIYHLLLLYELRFRVGGLGFGWDGMGWDLLKIPGLEGGLMHGGLVGGTQHTYTHL